MPKLTRLNPDQSSDLINEAIFDNFNVIKLMDAFEAGAFVDNDYDLENNSTFVCFAKHLKNSEIRGEEIDLRNLTNFYRVLVQNGLNFPENFPDQIKFHEISENLSNLIQDLQSEFEKPSSKIKPSRISQLETHQNYAHK